MNSRQKEILEYSLNNEEKALKKLFTTYKQSQTEINKKIRALKKEIDNLDVMAILATDEKEQEILLSRQRSKIYQKQYQEALKKQVGGILDDMQKSGYKTVSDYLKGCYENGFIGAMYDLQGQGIPMCFPLDQKAVLRATQLDSNISKGLYNHLGENVTMLKRKITAEISRGIVTGMSFRQIAKQISLKMTGTYDNPKGAYAYAVRIARTEGHRIQAQSAMDACYKAKGKGADVVKQWDSALDKKTRESHQHVDGEIRELSEKFSNGLMFPGDPSGKAAEVVNCRCALLQRARWALDNEELETLKQRAEYFGLDKTENFEDYKKKYLKASEQLTNTVKDDIIQSEKISNECERLVKTLDKIGVEYRTVKKHGTPLTDTEIISALSGGDRTSGSCASVGLAYIGQKGGLNVLDFRDGESRNFFSRKINLQMVSKLPGVKTITETAKSAVTAGKKLLASVEVGKEYYFVSGRHAAIVRKTKEGLFQYLELQSATQSGWTNFDGNPRYTLSTRFGDYRNSYGVESFMIDVDTLKDSSDLKKLLGYINTAENKQRKGKYGTIK